MIELLTAEGYEQTREKLRDLENRIDLTPEQLISVRRSYKMMMREFLQDIKLYEAKQSRKDPATPAL